MKYFYVCNTRHYADSVAGPVKISYGTIEANDDAGALAQIKELKGAKGKPDEKVEFPILHPFEREVPQP